MNLFFLVTLSLILFEFPIIERLNLFNQEDIIIDSNYRIEDIFFESKVPKSVTKNLTLISVEYFSFDEKLHRGQILIHKDLASDLIEIFRVIKGKNFPIGKVIPINHYNWSDENSMNDNNTSAFNYRFVTGTKVLSIHALGRAIDINPKLNPQLKNSKYFPTDSKYDVTVLGTIAANSFVIKEFTKRGWKWGGFWKSTKDYQHFEKLN